MLPLGDYNNPAVVIDHVLGGRPGKGDRLMKQWGSLHSLLKNVDLTDLTDRQKTMLRSAFRIGMMIGDGVPVTSIHSPSDAFNIPEVRALAAETREHLMVVLLDRRNHVIHTETVYVGSVSSSQVRVAEVLRPAILRNASAMLLAHNHPSEDPTPSPDDVAVTRAIKQACTLFDIDLFDHIVVTTQRYVSLKERGLGF